MPTELRQYQKDGVRRIHQLKGRCLLADQMSLGKTIQALTYAKEKPLLRPVLVICPAGLKWHWEGEAARHLNMRAEILESTSPPRRLGFKLHHELVIINYDILKHWREYLAQLKPELIIIDEAQNLKNPSTIRAREVRQLCASVDHVLALSATPIENYPVEFWSILNILCPEEFPNFRAYAREHCKPQRRWYGWVYKGAENLDKLHEKVSKIMIRRRKEDVLKELPPLIRTMIPLNCNLKEYEEAREDFCGWLRKQNRRRPNYKAEELTKMGYLKRLAAKLKMEAASKWIEDLMSEVDKLMIFAVHKSIVARLENQFNGHHVTITGDTPGSQRKHVVEQFHEDKQTRVLIGNIQAAGVGLNIKCSATAVFCEMGWTPGEHIQAESRVHGLGRGLVNVPTSVFYLVAKGTLEERLCSLLQEKQENNDRVLDGKVVEDFNIYEMLVEELRK